MKRTPFKNKPKKPLKRSNMRRVGKGSKTSPRGKITPNKGYSVPDWFKSIPLGSHGNNPTQKRYWKVVSDLVRQRDFKKYHGKCVSCPKRLERWQDGQGAHFRRYATCNSYFKFDERNVALSCSYCNQNEDGAIGHAFGEELKRRYGEGHLEWIEKENQRWRGVKMENHIIVERVEKLLEDNPWFVLP